MSFCRRQISALNHASGGSACNVRNKGCSTSGGAGLPTVPASGLMWTISWFCCCASGGSAPEAMMVGCGVAAVV